MREYFPRLLGNEGTKNRICRSILTKKMPHAFLIDGMSGSGKYTLALHIAAALNCESRTDGQKSLPCYECNNCRRIFDEGFVDIKVLGRAGDKATIGVGEIKEFRADMFLSATESEYKVYIIKNAEKMTPEAQNALLIVLEEPPKNVVIMLLCAGADKMLSTIRSRTQYIAMSRFTPSEIEEYLRKSSPEARRLGESEFSAAVLGSDGRIGRALELIDPHRAEEETHKRERILAFLRACAPKVGFSVIDEAVRALPEKRTELLPVLEGIISALSDMIIARRSKNGVTEFFTTARDADAAGADMSIKRLLRLYDIVNETHLCCARNANVSAMLMSMAAKIHLLRL